MKFQLPQFQKHFSGIFGCSCFFLALAQFEMQPAQRAPGWSPQCLPRHGPARWRGSSSPPPIRRPLCHPPQGTLHLHPPGRQRSEIIGMSRLKAFMAVDATPGSPRCRGRLQGPGAMAMPAQGVQLLPSGSHFQTHWFLHYHMLLHAYINFSSKYNQLERPLEHRCQRCHTNITFSRFFSQFYWPFKCCYELIMYRWFLKWGRLFFCLQTTSWGHFEGPPPRKIPINAPLCGLPKAKIVTAHTLRINGTYCKYCYVLHAHPPTPHTHTHTRAGDYISKPPRSNKKNLQVWKPGNYIS